MGPNSYPTGGHDRVGNKQLRRLRRQDTALLAEKYVDDVADFRAQFSGKLAAYGAVSETGLSWALFNGDHDDETDMLGQREVLLYSRYRPNVPRTDKRAAPLIRVVTNEPFLSEAGITYLTEDVTILENGLAVYMMDSVQTKEWVDGELQFIDDALTLSRAPIFMVHEEDQLLLNTNAGVITPNLMVTDDAFPDDRLFPFGNLYGNRLDDNVYALENAQQILQSVLYTDPSHTYRQAA